MWFLFLSFLSREKKKEYGVSCCILKIFFSWVFFWVIILITQHGGALWCAQLLIKTIYVWLMLFFFALEKLPLSLCVSLFLVLSFVWKNNELCISERKNVIWYLMLIWYSLNLNALSFRFERPAVWTPWPCFCELFLNSKWLVVV